jgi:hypothetical protein
MVCFALRLRVYWMGKSSLFPPVIRVVMRWLGGIAVNRSAAGNLVQGTVDAFHANERLTVIVPPEGTRGKVTHWKTGFYYIALGAGVPIALGYLDFGRKAGGIGRMFMPTGDIAADMEEIKAFYSGIQGKIHSSSVPTISRPSNSLPFSACPHPNMPDMRLALPVYFCVSGASLTCCAVMSGVGFGVRIWRTNSQFKGLRIHFCVNSSQ